MSYLALYRRYRPSAFDGVIGQEHIVRTLKNQIKSDRIGHAYLFCGARGTGKTSTAKIFAKAINCLNPKDGSPCGECEVCKALSDSSNLDVLEMDAASNNKVENVREIREKIQYPPVVGRYKVYIIDEVHMLTAEAFNALLKTLEEPPEHAVFVLATTEVHKLPSTILSRCMRFDFRLIPTKDIFNLVKGIYDELGKEYDDEAIYAVARAGAGCVRDALSIADICVSFKDGKLTYNDVLEVLGATDAETVNSLISAMINSNAGEALEKVEKLSELGKNVGVLCRDLITRIREIIIAKSCGNAKEILELPDEIYEEVKKAGEKASDERLLRTVEILSEAEASLKYSSSPRVVLETAVIKASMPENDYDLTALLARVSALEKALDGGGVIKPKETVRKVESVKPTESSSLAQMSFGGETVSGGEERVERAKEAEPSVKSAEVSADNSAIPAQSPSAGRIWGTVIRKFRSEGNMLLWVACQEMTATLRGRTLVLVAKDASSYEAVIKKENLTALAKTVKSVGDYEVEVVVGEKEEDEFQKSVEKMSETFGADKVKITD